MLECRAAVEADAGNAKDRESTVNTSPALRPGKSPGALWTGGHPVTRKGGGVETRRVFRGDSTRHLFGDKRNCDKT